jgi:hypothetical protein
VVWNAAKPSRWFAAKDFIPLVGITKRGGLSGEIGFDFEFVASEAEANGKDKIVACWGFE